MSSNQLIKQYIKQYKGFLNTSSLFKEHPDFAVFPFSENAKQEISFPNFPEIPANIVLGKRIELFFQSFLKASNNYKILAANLQISKNNITTGELDFLLRKKDTDQLLHLELVYKFYLYDPNIEGEIQRWIGPNRKDTLEKKLNKLVKRQLPFLHKKETEEELSKIGLHPKDFKQQVCFLAQLFVPVDLYGEHFRYINKECITGYWLDIEQLKSRHQPGDSYHIPEKENWLTSPETSNWIDLTGFINQIEDLHNQKRSPLCWKRNIFENFEIFFVTWW